MRETDNCEDAWWEDWTSENSAHFQTAKDIWVLASATTLNTCLFSYCHLKVTV